MVGWVNGYIVCPRNPNKTNYLVGRMKYGIMMVRNAHPTNYRLLFLVLEPLFLLPTLVVLVVLVI